MTVRDLMRKLIEFNPDSDIEIVVNNKFRPTLFNILEQPDFPFKPEETSKRVSIYLMDDNNYHEEDCCCNGMNEIYTGEL